VGSGEVRLFIKRLWEKVDTEGFGAGLRREGGSEEGGGGGGRGVVGSVETMVLRILSNSASQTHGIRRSFAQPFCCISSTTPPPGTKLAFVIFKCPTPPLLLTTSLPSSGTSILPLHPGPWTTTVSYSPPSPAT